MNEHRVTLTARDEWLRHYLKQTLTSRQLDDAMRFSGAAPTRVIQDLVTRGAPIERRRHQIKQGQGFTWAYPIKKLIAVVRAWGIEVTQHNPRPWVREEVAAAKKSALEEEVARLNEIIGVMTRRQEKQQTDHAVALNTAKFNALADVQNDFRQRGLLPGDTEWLFGELMTAHELRPLPGVYWLIGADGAIVYVGLSRNCLSRMAGHRDKVFVAARMIHIVDDDKRAEVERILIRAMRPMLNIHMVPKGRAEAA